MGVLANTKNQHAAAPRKMLTKMEKMSFYVGPHSADFRGGISASAASPVTRTNTHNLKTCNSENDVSMLLCGLQTRPRLLIFRRGNQQGAALGKCTVKCKSVQKMRCGLSPATRAKCGSRGPACNPVFRCRSDWLASQIVDFLIKYRVTALLCLVQEKACSN